MIHQSQFITQCRSCGSSLGGIFCDLGTMAVANSYIPPERAQDFEPIYPLKARVCSQCRLVQLDTNVDAHTIFSDYAYFSSASATWLGHARRLALEMTGRLDLGPKSFVVEVASNDGYLLRNFVQAKIPCLGVEPAANIAQVAQAAGIPTEMAFFGRETAERLVAAHGAADLVVANNVMAHVPDINDFAAGLALMIGRKGMISVEVPHLLRLVDGVQFDTIYHEHYLYWSLYAFEALLARHGLAVVDVERLPTHGGSLRIMARKAPSRPSATVMAVRAEEKKRGLADEAFYTGFDERVRAVTAGLRSWIEQDVASGRKVCAYGAAAKGNTLLNAAGISAALILAVADRSPAKQGRLLPGSHVPVVTPEAMLAMRPDDILILPWNIASEIVRDMRAAGFAGRMLIAVPELKEV